MFENDLNYEWRKVLIKKLKRNLFILKVCMVGVWGIPIVFGIAAFFLDDYKFSQAVDYTTIELDNLSPDDVSNTPYAQVVNGCIDESFLTITERYGKNYYYLLRACDNEVSIPTNNVVVKSDIGYNEISYGFDSLETTKRFLTGKLVYGLPHEREVEAYIKKSWHLSPADHVYMLTVNHTPKDELLEDLIAFGFGFVIAVICFVILYYQKKSVYKEHDVWVQYFIKTYHTNP